MNSKVRFIPLIVLGAIILSLIAVIPAFSDTGKLRFYDNMDTDEDQGWARSDGMVHLEVDDSDLDVPVKYVILPNELMMVGTVTDMLGDTVMTATSTALAVEDTVLVEGNTIREVTAVSSDGKTLTLNRPVADGSSGALYEVVSDAAKLNVEDCEACAPAQMEVVTGLGYINLDNAPVADSGVGDNLANRFSGDGDSRTNSHDVRLVDMDGEDLTDSMYEVQQVNNSEDRVELSAAAAGQMAYVVYWGSSRNDTGSTVDVRSSADSEGITVVLTETGASSGVFRGSIMLTEDDSDEATGMLRVNPSGSVTLRYDDDGTRRTKAINVETTRPVLSNFSPANNFASQNDRPEVMFDVTDSDSGVAHADVFVVFALLDGAEVMSGSKMARSVSVDEDGRLKSITDGVSAEQRLPDELRDTSLDEFTVAWWVVTQDMAGNTAVSDQNTDSDSSCDPDMFPGLGTILTGDYDDDPVGVDELSDKDVGDDFASGCQPFKVVVDDIDPTLTAATTGSFWDTSSDDDDKTNEDRNAAKPTSIRLDFDEKLDGASVSASDFEVDGKAPLDAEHFSGNSDSVFLTVPALDPHDKPVVELVGEVEDLAGNTANSGTTGDDDGGPTHDGIAPTVTVTLEGVTSGDRPVTDSEIKITVETDENTLNPQVTITRVASATSDGEGLLGDDVEMRTPKVKSPRVYETSWSTSTAGLYNVFVTADDGSGEGEAGVSGDMMMVDHDDDEDTADVSAYSPVDLSSDTKALLFEVDNSGPEFALNPEESDDPNAFIQVDFGAEGSEYSVTVKDAGEDGYYGTADDGADTDDTTDLDTYGMVTILSSTLAGDDITPERLGDASFLFAAPDLAVGEYKVKIDAEDSAGNDMESEMTLKITERKPFSLNIRAGVSLISFPGDPADPDINAVFPADHPVQEIATYDPTMPGKWFASQRDESTGMLDGNLLTISGNQAYLVRSESSKSLSVVIIRRSAHETIIPPQIDLVKGWNLVPVLDVTYGLSDGDDIGYMTYFGDNGNIDRVYGVDTIRNRLVLVESDDNLKVGKGYWVFASAATSVAPGTAADDE